MPSQVEPCATRFYISQKHVDVPDIQVAQTYCTGSVPLALPPSVSLAGNATVLDAISLSLRGRGTIVTLVANNEHHQITRDVFGIMTMWWSVQCTHEPEVKSKRIHSLSPIAILIEKDLDHTTMIVKTFLGSDDGDNKIKIWPLRVQIAELRRPVSYFWSVHDFVKGLRDALKGHAFLVAHGILHRGLSENNIGLSCHPNAARGQITDFDTAIRYSHPRLEHSTTGMMVTPGESLSHTTGTRLMDDEIKATQTNPRKAYRTVNPSCASFNVLSGNKPTDCDDVESFFYILILFLLSYKGPTERWKSLQAMRCGFITGSELSARTRNWPPPYESWSSDSDLNKVVSSKTALFDHSGFVDFFIPLAKALIEWCPNDFTICVLRLVANCWSLFAGTNGSSTKGPLRVQHEAFIKELDLWLEKTPLPRICNHCPFLDENGDPMV